MSFVSDILNSKTLRVILILLVIYWLFQKSLKFIPDLFKDIRKDVAESQTGKDSNTVVSQTTGQKVDVNVIAEGFKNAMNPSGFETLEDLDGTDEEAIFRLAEEANGNFDKVSKAFRQLTKGQELLARLRNELDPQEYDIFAVKAGLKI